MGTPAEEQKIFFDPFAQVHVSTTRKCGDTEVGLTISMRWVDMMGGNLDGE
jgi:signal transduction histidine kinase